MTPDYKSDRISVWLQTTGGIVGVLLLVQFLTGVLLAFYYVPSVDHAHTTVSYIEKVVSSGSWLRSLHHYGSQWLALFAFLHVVRLFWDRVYAEQRIHWIAAVLLLMLVMAGRGHGVTRCRGMRAPFSARALRKDWFRGCRLRDDWGGCGFWVAVTSQRSRCRGSLPCTCWLRRLRSWVFIWWKCRARCVLVQRESKCDCWWCRVCGTRCLVFEVSSAARAAGGNNDRGILAASGARSFLWLYQSLKYVPGGLGSIVGVMLPGLALLVLASLPWLGKARLIGGVLLTCFALTVTIMTLAAYVSDRAPGTREQLAKQAAQEGAWRGEPFNPRLLQGAQGGSQTSGSGGPPVMYTKFCANCHGARGEGAQQGRLRFPPLLDVAAKPRRTADDIVSLLKDPTAYGLQPPMRSFADKLTEPEMKEIAAWVVQLKK